jgi:hypothetical protein
MNKYPSKEGRKKIIAERKQLAHELMMSLITTNEPRLIAELDRLSDRYGRAEVERQVNFLRDSLAAAGAPDEQREAFFYDKYIGYYRLFGGKRPLLSREEYATLNEECAPLAARQEFEQALTSAEQERLTYLTDLMLREARFWEGLVPEDPPPAMPKLDRPAPKKAAAVVPIQSGAGGPLCPRDGFPLLKIDGKLECSAEYIDRCVGGEAVVDVVQRGTTTYYVFENGHQVPLLCGCCGGPLAITDLAQERKHVGGRRLESMSAGPLVTEDGREYPALSLEFSKRGLFSKRVSIPVSFEVAARLRHPVDCPYQKRAAPPREKHSRKKGRRK